MSSDVHAEGTVTHEIARGIMQQARAGIHSGCRAPSFSPMNDQQRAHHLRINSHVYQLVLMSISSSVPLSVILHFRGS